MISIIYIYIYSSVLIFLKIPRKFQNLKFCKKASQKLQYLKKQKLTNMLIYQTAFIAIIYNSYNFLLQIYSHISSTTLLTLSED